MSLRIYADFNGLVRGPNNRHRTAVVLDTFGTLRDLANAGVCLEEGLAVIAMDESDELEDLEGQGTVYWDEENRWWVAEFDAEGVRYVPKREWPAGGAFGCVSCRSDLTSWLGSRVPGANETCLHCSASLWSPLEPPEVDGV